MIWPMCSSASFTEIEWLRLSLSRAGEFWNFFDKVLRDDIDVLSLIEPDSYAYCCVGSIRAIFI